jgi:hypothetical protein
MRKLSFILSITFLSALTSACGGDDGPASSDDATEDSNGDGDGDPTTGDGDGDPTTGDGDGDPTTGDGDGDPTTGDGDGDGDATGDGDGDATGDGDGDATGDGDGDGDPQAGYCAQGCVEDEDCCPIGAVNCPGDDYPNNYVCDQGVCEFGGCTADSDCTGAVTPNDECHAIEGVGVCFEPCANDNDCLLQVGTTCSGVADDDTKYCAPEPEAPCEEDADCGGAGLCDVESGECMCSSDEECDAGALNVCVLE